MEMGNKGVKKQRKDRNINIAFFALHLLRFRSSGLGLLRLEANGDGHERA